MDSRIIDVAIGLALVFALTSLFAATLVEALSTLRKQRGEVLKKAIVSFLGDSQTFATELLKHPLIVSLAPSEKADAERKPSYIGADVMITSLLSHLTQKYAAGIRPASPAELVTAVRAGAAAGTSRTTPTTEFVDGLASLLHGVENDWITYEKRLQAWFDSVAERSSGWYKRWTQWWLFGVGCAIAIALNINPLVIAPRLWNDAALREAVVKAGQAASENYQQATAASEQQAGTAAPTPLPALIPPQPIRTEQTTAVLRNYSRLMQAMVTAGEQARARADDTGAEARVRTLQELNALPPKLDRMRMPDDGTTISLQSREDANASIDRVLSLLETLLPSDAIYTQARGLRDALAKSIAEERAALEAATKKPEQKNTAQPDSAACPDITEPAAKNLCLRLRDLNQLQEIGLPIGWSSHPFTGDDHACKSKCGSTVQFLLNLLLAVLGWVVTGVAVTLGAPFWFDTLSRLVKLRGSGTRIDGDSAKSAQDKQTTLAVPTTTTMSGAGFQRDPMSDALNAAEAALREFEVQRIQRGLGLTGAQVTGYFDPQTRGAIKQWQTTQGADASGELTQMQIQQLLGLSQGATDEYAG